ncbi:MAG: hypothetical protein AAGF46_13095 [Pseudomonadota bacterium]
MSMPAGEFISKDAEVSISPERAIYAGVPRTFAIIIDAELSEGVASTASDSMRVGAIIEVDVVLVAAGVVPMHLKLMKLQRSNSVPRVSTRSCRDAAGTVWI